MITISPDNGIIHQSKNLRWPNGDTSHLSFASARLANGYFSTRASNVTRHVYTV